MPWTALQRSEVTDVGLQDGSPHKGNDDQAYNDSRENKQASSLQRSEMFIAEEAIGILALR